MRSKPRELFRFMSSSYMELLNRVKSLSADLNSETDIEELCDSAYAIREAHKQADDLRKKLNALQIKHAQLICALWLRSPDSDKIKTEYCTVTPVIKQIASVPSFRKEPEVYRTLMEALGIPAEMYETGVVRPSYEAFCDYISELTAQGKPLPKGLDVAKVYQNPTVNIRKRKGVLEDGES